MSDVWPSGFDGVDFTYGKFQSVTSEFGEEFLDTDCECLCGLVFSNEEPAKATMHAINNHDKLVEALKVNHEWLSINPGYTGSPFCEKNIALLKELGHEI